MQRRKLALLAPVLARVSGGATPAGCFYYPDALRLAKTALLLIRHKAQAKPSSQLFLATLFIISSPHVALSPPLEHTAAADAAAEAEARQAAESEGAPPPAVKDVELPTSLPSVVEMQVCCSQNCSY